MQKPFRFDLHMHSDASSDGQFTPKELIDIARENGMNAIALTDHDTLRNTDEFAKEAKKAGIDTIIGIEVSTLYKGEYSVHLLGYNVDPEDSWLNSLEAMQDEIRRTTFHTRVEKLCRKYNLTVDEEEILRQAGDKNPWFTLMDVVFQMPEAQNIEDFQDYLPGGKRCSPAPVNFYWDRCATPDSDLYVRVDAPDLFEAIDRVHQAGGIAVLAHPFRTFDHKDEELEKLIESGLDGIEAYSNYHSPEQIDYYRTFAENHDLMITCGSDFHGEKKPDIVMGDYHLDRDGTPYFERFSRTLSQHKNSAK